MTLVIMGLQTKKQNKSLYMNPSNSIEMDVNLSKLQELVVKDRGDWHAAVRGISKSWKQFSESTTTRLGKIPM